MVFNIPLEKVFIPVHTMSEVLVKLEIPRDWKKFRLPAALNNRLRELLDRQDSGHKLSRAERGEAQALVELVDMLTLMKLRAEVAAGRRLNE